MSLKEQSKEEFEDEAIKYFESISTKPLLQLTYYEVKSLEDGMYEICLPLKSATILWILKKYSLDKSITLRFIKIDVPSLESFILLCDDEDMRQSIFNPEIENEFFSIKLPTIIQ